MWRLTLEDDSIITEKMIGYWDNLGKDIKIKEIVFRVYGNKVVFSNFSGCCIARIGELSVSAQQRHVGYCIYCIKDNIVEETILKFNNISSKEYSISELQVPERCIRNGVN